MGRVAGAKRALPVFIRHSESDFGSASSFLLIYIIRSSGSLALALIRLLRRFFSYPLIGYLRRIGGLRIRKPSPLKALEGLSRGREFRYRAALGELRAFPERPAVLEDETREFLEVDKAGDIHFCQNPALRPAFRIPILRF